MKSPISCIVPVYNEATRVRGVLSVLVGHPDIAEVIVVNDGSTDTSEEVLKTVSGIQLISYQANGGKSHAVKLGLERATHELVMTVDSDLIGLDREQISALIKPIVDGAADMSLSIRKNDLKIYKWSGIDPFTGERVFRKDLIGDLALLDTIPGFGLETFINLCAIRKKIRVVSVLFPRTITPAKEIKFGLWTGLKGDLRMTQRIISYVGFAGLVKMYLGTRRLQKNHG